MLSSFTGTFKFGRKQKEESSVTSQFFSNDFDLENKTGILDLNEATDENEIIDLME